MSTIYSDAAGNKYLGDCQWGNHDINYQTINYLISGSYGSTLSDDLNALIDATTLRKNSVLSQSLINTWTNNYNTLVSFSGNGDSISNRFSFGRNYLRADSSGSGGAVTVVTQSTLNNGSTKAASYELTSFSGLISSGSGLNSLVTVGCASSSSLALIIGNISSTQPSGVSTFWFAGELLNVNTNFNYYNAGRVFSSCVMGRYTGQMSSVSGQHYIANTNKSLLQTGRADYAISCSDGQTPTSQWATDMWVYDNNATLGYPVIGRVPNMLLGIGTYTYLKPVKIQGNVFPDSGSPWYLPVGTFAGKTLLMRCYSSMV